MNATGVMNGNFRSGAYYRYQQQVERQAAIEETNQLDFGDALEALREADPAGWETWFDNCNEIPEIITWSDTAQVQTICQKILERAALVR